jgi:hypothetical protein
MREDDVISEVTVLVVLDVPCDLCFFENLECFDPVGENQPETTEQHHYCTNSSTLRSKL